MDQRSVEDLFERNADMRLLERRNADLNPTRPDGAQRRTAASFGAESIVPSGGDEPVHVEPAPRLRVTVAAVPATGVIAGALVGVAVDVHNDGAAPAPEALLQLALPHEVEYRAGTLRLDGREPQAPDRLFGSGLPIARLPGESSAKVTFQLQVLAGTNALFLQPRLQATGVPVVGTAGLSIKRGALPTAAPSAEAPKPFYELEADEVDEEALSEEALPVLPPVLVAEPAIAAEAPVVAEPAVAAQAPVPAEPLPEKPSLPIAAETAAPVTAAAAAVPLPAPVAPKPPTQAKPTLPPPDAPAPEARPAVAAEAPAAEPTPSGPQPAAAERPAPGAKRPEPPAIRIRSVGAPELSLLQRLFSNDAPGAIAHFVAISTIACTQAVDGSDAGGFDLLVQRDLEALGRALVLARLGKPMSYRVDQRDLDVLAAGAPAPERREPAKVRLRRDVGRSETAAVAALVQRSDRDPTIRLRIALLALAAARVEGVTDAKLAEQCALAFAGYRAGALAWLAPLCAQSAGQPTFEIPAPPPALDAAGRRLTAALSAVAR